MSAPLTPAVIEACRRACACDAGLAWARETPRTVAELIARNRAWAVWLAIKVPDLPDAVRDELQLAGYGRSWWRAGKRHRADGPAIEYANGTREWWRAGKRLPDPEEAKA